MKAERSACAVEEVTTRYRAQAVAALENFVMVWLLIRRYKNERHTRRCKNERHTQKQSAQAHLVLLQQRIWTASCRKAWRMDMEVSQPVVSHRHAAGLLAAAPAV